MNNLDELTEKVNSLTQQISYLTEQAQIAERQRKSRDELMSDLTTIGTEAYHLVIDQLEEIQDYIDLSDLLRLVKRLMRNGRNLERLLDQLESLSDLVDSMSPMADEVFGKTVDTLAEMERKGYFQFMRSGLNILDTVVTSFTQEDLERLGSNIVLILNTVKDMTQPEILNFVRSTLLVAEQEMEKPVDGSTLGLIRQMSDPSVRKGLALTMRVMHVIGSQASSPGVN